MAVRYDLVILGGGAAAFSAAIRADRNGASALMIDGGTIGGTCVNVGCVPSKRLLAVGDEYFRVANRPFQGLKLQRKIVAAKVGGKQQRFEADALLVATGRTPNTGALNLPAAGVAVKEDKAVEVDAGMRTTAPHIFAAGDVKGKPMLETTAAKEGYIAAENALADRGLTMDYRAVPHAVFTNPAVASVGLTDVEANRGAGVRCACNTVLLEQVPKPRIVDDTRGLVKIVAEAKSHRVLGVHILASLAPEIIHEGVLAVKHGLTLEDLIDTVHVFPTFSEAIKLAALSFFEDVDKLSCCAV